MKTFKRFLPFILIIASIGALKDQEYIPAIFTLILGLLIHPKFSEPMKQKIKLWNNKNIRITTYLVILFTIGTTLKKSKNTESKDNLVLNNKIETKETEKPTYEADRVKQTKKVITWEKDFDKSDIIGDWILIKYFNTGETVTIIKDKSEEQKVLKLTKTTYQTSYPYGMGDNSIFDYELSNSCLSVVTSSRLRQEIYKFKIELNDDKNYLKLIGDDDLIQIFKNSKN